MVSLILLGAPGSAIPKYSWLTLPYADKWVHCLLFFILVFLFAWPLKLAEYTTLQRKKYFFLLALGGIAFGTLMEFIQDKWIPNRSFEIADIMADSCGCIAAYIYSLRNFLQKG